MANFAPNRGTLVHHGQTIGCAGSTGLSTDPHPHFEVTKGSRQANLLLGSGPGDLENANVARFQNELRQLLLVGADQVD